MVSRNGEMEKCAFVSTKVGAGPLLKICSLFLHSDLFNSKNEDKLITRALALRRRTIKVLFLGSSVCDGNEVLPRFGCQTTV